MSQRNPASLIIDINGNLVGVVYDGTVYRLQTETTLTDGAGNTADMELTGTRVGLSVEYPELLQEVRKLTEMMGTVLLQLADITGEENPL